jgi:capsular polysaccharide export protein
LKVIGQQCNIISLIKQVDEVYVMTSGVGLEALMIGKPVSCFGVPFYSGWGLTNDRVPVPNPRRQLSVESLFAATFLKYNLFYHPETQQPCSMDACIEWIVQNKPFFEPIKLEW